MKDMPDVEIKKSLFTFTPKYLQLSETTVNIGKNDITADSRFENYIGYVLKGSTLKGNLNIRSNYFNLNDFITASADEASTSEAASTDSVDTAATGIVEVPRDVYKRQGYKALVVPAAHLMPSDVLAHLYELAKQGATIVFLENYPTDVPGYGQLEQKRKSYQQTLKNLPAVSFSETTVTPIGKGKIITGTDYARTLACCNIPAEEMKTKFGLQTIRRVNDTGHHYFISSLQNKGVDGWITLGTNAETAALFNPMTVECGEAKVRQVDGKTQVYLQLKSGESIIPVSYTHLDGTSYGKRFPHMG